MPEKPHESKIEYVRPIAIAPPAGSVFATDVVVWVRTAALPMPSPGNAAWFAHQYVTRLKIVASTRDNDSSGVRVRIQLQDVAVVGELRDRPREDARRR